MTKKDPLEDDDSSSGKSELSTADASPLEDKSDEERERLVGIETKMVFRSRIVLLLVLFFSMLAVALTVFFYIKTSEERDFENQFEEQSAKVFEAIGSTLGTSLGALDAFAVGMTAYTKHTNQSWPYVVVPEYAVKCAKLLGLSKATLVTTYPVVSTEQREKWENFSLAADAWVDEGIEVQNSDKNFRGKNVTEWSPYPIIHGNFGPIEGPGPYLPTWQTYPVAPIWSPYNWDIANSGPLRETLLEILITEKVLIETTLNLYDESDPESMENAKGTQDWIRGYLAEDDDETLPLTAFYYPIIENSQNSVEIAAGSKMVGVLAMTLFWHNLIEYILPEGAKGIFVVFGNECNQTFTYRVDGAKASYVGNGDLHDPEYDYLERSERLLNVDYFSVSAAKYTGQGISEDYCQYWIKVYPSNDMLELYSTNNGLIFAIAVVLIFGFTYVIFCIYDWQVERRQRKVLTSALQSSAIVSSLFPSIVRDRLFPSQEERKGTDKKNKNPLLSAETPKSHLQSFLNTETVSNFHDAPPIAELFPDTTVLFADIAGFTAWSSVREPAQVFSLLETIYSKFDSLAKKRKVFKVETIGDSYVAVTGLPDPNPNHALLMAKFAKECRQEMLLLTKKLEVTLGPDTGDLKMRFGLNSGPVTAGVLRGEKSRFQLFGDTVNTAARMESNGRKDKIHVSESTATLLIAAGKEHWVTKRDELVEAKGKGLMQTYWCEPATVANSVVVTESSVEEAAKSSEDKITRLVEWNVDVFTRLIRQIISRRKAMKKCRRRKSNPKLASSQNAKFVLDEVKEIIELPTFDAEVTQKQNDIESDELSNEVLEQLRGLVSTIASLYIENPFHNFEHASHVTMSVVKLMKRIVAPTDSVVAATAKLSEHSSFHKTLHDHTYGITSDPLTQFACVFAAIIHDVAHPGVSNIQLVKEDAPLAKYYQGRSVAEQNSVDISWQLFMDERYQDLRDVVCASEEELQRLRQLVINSVMATDVFDPNLKALRNSRWEKAFNNDENDEGCPQDQINRKATIVIEHLIQASDVSHTMQHWHVYRKWNERLFEEMLVAYKSGRAEKDPSEYWYQGEIGFFDFYIIPLAKKLRDCGVFGVSSDEFLDYASQNRAEWESRGQEVVAEMKNVLEKKYAKLTCK